MKLSPFLALIVCLALSGAQLRAYEPPPYVNVSQSSANGQWLVVVLTQSDRSDAIGQKYPQSGVYRNDGSTEPLWTFNWYSPFVWISDDGKTVVRIHASDRLEITSQSDLAQLRRRLANFPAVTFYINGQEGLTWFVGDLFSVSSVNLSPKQPYYGWYRTHSVDDTNNHLSFLTTWDTSAVIDLKSGAILKTSDRPSFRRSPWRWIDPILLGLSILLALLAVLCFALSVLTRRPKSASNAA